MTTPDSAKSPDWLTPRDNTRRGHHRRRRSGAEERREQALRDWYGNDMAAAEVEANQGREQNVASVVNGLLTSWNMADRIVLRELVDRWSEVVGAAFARHTQPSTLRNRVLEIEVYNSVIRFQLEGAKKELLRKAKEVAGEEVQGIRFIAGGRSPHNQNNRKG